MKRRTIIKPKKQEGMLLVGAILGLLLIGTVVTGGIYYYNNKRIEDRGKLAGEQIRILGQAVDEYISINRDKIANLQSDNHLKCQSNGFCEITVAGLRDNGELPNTFSDKNAWGSEYKIQIKRVGQAPDYQITGVVVTTQAPNKPKMLGFALKTGGANAGNNLIDLTKISGTSGLWSYTNQDYSIISNQQYQLAYRVGYNASQYSPYLRRDGSLNMTGDLQMAGHNIKDIDWLNANNIKINGSAQVNNNLNIGGAATANFLQVNGDTSVGGKITGDLIPRQTVVAGQNCSPNGLVAKDETGGLLSCVSGSWVSNLDGNNKNYLLKINEKDKNTYFFQTNTIITTSKPNSWDKVGHITGLSLLIGKNKGICLSNQTSPKQCNCNNDETGIILNRMGSYLLISCEKTRSINFQEYENICNNTLNIRQGHVEKNSTAKHYAIDCKQKLNEIKIGKYKGILGIINTSTTSIDKHVHSSNDR